MTRSKAFAAMIAITLIMVGIIVAGINSSKDRNKTNGQISTSEAMEELGKYLKKIDVTQAALKKGQLDDLGGNTTVLPDIETKAPLTVEGRTGAGYLNLEIFTSTEKGSGGTDNWLNDVAEKFNREGYTIGDQKVTVSVRSIASGLAVDYIISGVHIPDAFTPSNSLWGEMIAARGVEVKTVSDRLLGNTAGVLVSKSTYQLLESTYGEVSLSTIVQATIDNKIAMGYTNPYTSSAGMNFLISCLSEFDAADPLSDTAAAKFQEFQKNVPLVSYTTLQMRNAAETGVLDAFVLEYQGYYNDTTLRDYIFVPYGVNHDNPMLAIGTQSSEKAEALQIFTDYCLNSESQSLGTKYGFNRQDDYKSNVKKCDGTTLLSAQSLWKAEKDAGKPVVAVFVADCSGSMAGDPLYQLKESLNAASQKISNQNYIGLISYNEDVQIELPIAQFDLTQRQYFKGAVDSLSPGGSTATYDAVLVGLNMLQEAIQDIPDAKPLLFLLSDGEQNEGYSLSKIRDVVDGLDVPVYTIGYNADLSELKELSEINEAACINENTEGIVYALQSLFNAQM